MTSAAASQLVPPFGAGECLQPGYTVTEHLRRGDRLDVYAVWSAHRQCACVAKMLRPDRVCITRNRRRLVREGRLLLRLSHPHIVRAYQVIAGDNPALILETLSGGTLAHLIAHNPRGLRLADVVILGLHLCSAVQYLHAEGFLHLDLKPSNIISQCGVAKVLDLDIAQPPGPGHGHGTRQYMAPEQVRREVLGPAADVWGLGVVLFEAATGHLPFASHATTNTSRLVQDAESIRTWRPRWPRSVCGTIDAALHANPRQRPTLHELARSLESAV
jgi:eukaryotic-like serine/threonine-protein kinase